MGWPISEQPKRCRSQSLRDRASIVASLVFAAAVSLSNSLPSDAAPTSENPAEAKARLQQIERRREELHKRVTEMRKKEQVALGKLHVIQRNLNVTQGALNDKKHQLKKTENKINECEVSIDQTQRTEVSLTTNAQKRLREIYEGQRLSFIEMIFQIDSLQTLLDRFYYQERIADEDKNLLQQLRAEAAKLHQSKSKLGEEKNKLGDLVSEFAKKAMEIAKEKLSQEQTAKKLRSQRAFYEQAERQLALESQRLETQIVAMMNSQKKHAKHVVKGSGNMCMPLNAQVTSPFGWRRHPIFGVRKFHTGVDLAGPNRCAIRAADSGSVLYTGWYGGYGKVAIIGHGDSMATLYAHMSKIAVAVGDSVQKGDVVGYEGTTGFSTGPHLHFEVRVDGKPQNPMNFVR